MKMAYYSHTRTWKNTSTDERQSTWINAILSGNGLGFLIRHGYSVNDPFSYLTDDVRREDTPLLFAVWQDRPQIAEWLMDAGADVNATDNFGRTPMHAAARSGCPVVERLVEKGANVNATDKKGYTPLHMAFMWRNPDIIETLIEMGADVNAVDKNRRTPLHETSRLGYNDIAGLLIKKGVDVNATDGEGCTPLHLAVVEKNADIIEILIDAGADLNARDHYGRTPLLVFARMCWGGNKASVSHLLGAIAKVLIEKGPDVNASDSQGRTAAHFASRSPFPELLHLLVNYGADVNATTIILNTPLHCATDKSDWALREDSERLETVETLTAEGIEKRQIIIEILLENGADIKAKNSAGYTPLDAIKSHYYCNDIVPSMLSWKLRQAATEGDIAMVEWILEQGNDIPDLDTDWLLSDHSYLMQAAIHGHENTLWRLLKVEGMNVNSTDPSKNTALHWACEKGHLGCVTVLLQNGASSKKRNALKKTPLDLAKIEGHLDVVDFVKRWQSPIVTYISSRLPLTNNDNFKRRMDHLGRQLAQKEHQCATLRLEQETAVLQREEMLSNGNAEDDTGKLELKSNMETVRQKTNKIDTLHSQMKEIMAVIEELKAEEMSRKLKTTTDEELETRSVKSFITVSFKSAANCLKKKSTLLEAVTAGDEELVVQILKKKPDLNMKDNDKQTPLFLACKFNRHDIIRLLVDRGADVNVCNKDNATPLYIASENGYALVVDYLLENKADVNSPTKDETTPLIIAADNGHVMVVEALLKAGARMNAARRGGYTPLYVAARNDRREVVEMLLEHGADANASSYKKMSPLHRAAVEGHRQIVELLLEYGAQTDALNSQRETPDTIAEQHGKNVVRDLIVSWRTMSQSERHSLTTTRRKERKEQRERLMQVSEYGSLVDITVDLNVEEREVLELKDRARALNTALNTIPEESDLGKIDNILQEVLVKQERFSELRCIATHSEHDQREKVTKNFIIINQGVVHGTLVGNCRDINVGEPEPSPSLEISEINENDL